MYNIVVSTDELRKTKTENTGLILKIMSDIKEICIKEDSPENEK